LKRFQGTTYQIFGLVTPWTKHVKTGRDLLRRAVTSANQIGDLTIVNRRLKGTPHRRPTGTPSIGVLCW